MTRLGSGQLDGPHAQLSYVAARDQPLMGSTFNRHSAKHLVVSALEAQRTSSWTQRPLLISFDSNNSLVNHHPQAFD